MKNASKFAISLLALSAAACGNHDAMAEPAGSAGAAGAAGTPTWSSNVLTKFDATAGELPEGLAVKDGFAFAGFAPTGEIVKVDLHSGQATHFGKIPTPVAGKGFGAGLAFGPDGKLYAALASFDPSVQAGIYQLPSAGGVAALYAKDEHLTFPNGLVFDENGDLFVTDSSAGSIERVSRDGTVTPWATTPLLLGDHTACGGTGNEFDIGANGLARHGNAYYATNNDRGLILRFNIEADGSAGPAEIYAGPDCERFGGADGLISDPDGNLFIADNRQDKLVRLSQSGTVDLIASGAAVDFPASFAWSGATLLVTNFALVSASTGKPARPGLLTVSAM